MDQDKELIDSQVHGTLSSYILGLILSIFLTLGAYILVTKQMLTGGIMLLSLMGLALVQVFVQLICFLHIAKESKPRWNLGIFLFMILVIGIIVTGTLWIMYNLNERVMPPMDSLMNLQRQQ